jgi:hypothetical protein
MNRALEIRSSCPLGFPVESQKFAGTNKKFAGNEFWFPFFSRGLAEFPSESHFLQIFCGLEAFTRKEEGGVLSTHKAARKCRP